MCEVLAVDPPRQIAWRTISTPLFVDSSDWRITLQPAGAGTRIVQTFAVTKCPRWWEWIVARFVPRHIDRSARAHRRPTPDRRRRRRHQPTFSRQHVSAISAAGTALIALTSNGDSLGGMGAEEYQAAQADPAIRRRWPAGCSVT
jgi:hypothetical protein